MIVCAWCHRTRGPDGAWRCETSEGEDVQGLCPSCSRNIERTLSRGRTVAETVAVVVADEEAEDADLLLVGDPDEAELPARVRREIQSRLGPDGWAEVRDLALGCYRAVLARRLASW
jgi:hypothetical protein